MLKLVGTIVVLGAVAVFSPQYIENAPSACGALAMKALSLNPKTAVELQNPMSRGMMSSFAAPLVEGMMSVSYPNIPAPVACSMSYWNVTFNPTAQAELAKFMKS